MRIIAGLGNPGSRHAGNRHNIGFMALDVLASRWRFGPWREKFLGLVADGTIGDEKVLALKPMTYMNESGRSVAAAMRFYKLTPDDVIVVHDEIELAAGKMRVKKGGGAAGNNGIRSIDAHIGPDYHRVRLGVGHPGVKHLVHDYVLQDFPKADEPWVEKLLAAVAEAMPLMVAGDGNGFMNKVTLTINPPPPRPARETAAPER
ncbi:MAG: aminoacyl-tRNA hydrolase [Alphaproteobacteria bacterium]|nr:aminoacyl-tRNA hydrolase [Alphaproteobacteria bacterium]